MNKVYHLIIKCEQSENQVWILFNTCIKQHEIKNLILMKTLYMMILDLTNSEYLTDEEKSNKEFMNHLQLKLTKSQKDCIEMVLTNHLSIIEGRPGCGKTTTIGLIIYNLLKNSNKRILVCAQTNQAVENTVKFVSLIMKEMGKIIIWIQKNDEFESEEEFINATDEQTCMSS